MRQHKILTRTLLILSIINFALTAPVAVRRRPEVRLDANVSGKVTAASQKQQDSSDKRGSTSTNVPGLDNAPPHKLLARYIVGPYGVRRPPLTPDSPGSESDYVPSSSESSEYVESPYVSPSSDSPTGSRLPLGPIPVAGSLSSPPPPSPHLSQPEPSEDRFSSPSAFSVISDATDPRRNRANR